MTNSLDKVKKIIKNYREKKKLTQENLGLEMGYSKGTVKKMEGSKNKITSNFLSTFLELPDLPKREKLIIENHIKSLPYKEKNKKNSKHSFVLKNDDIKKVLIELFDEYNLCREENATLISKKKEKNVKKINRNEFFKINSLMDDYETTSRIIKIMWQLNDESYKNFSELQLLLSTNDAEKNKKMKTGIETVANNIIEMGEKLLSFVNDKDIINID